MTRLLETKCPFYQRERTLSITCEGLIDKTIIGYYSNVPNALAGFIRNA